VVRIIIEGQDEWRTVTENAKKRVPDCSLITSCFIRRPSKSNGFDISLLEVEEILAGLVEDGFIHSILVACIAVCLNTEFTCSLLRLTLL
jgi:hypothetical protein